MGRHQRFSLSKKIVTRIFTHPSGISWKSNKKKESLVAYLHQFKREASRCKFDNDAATIRIFIKGLRNAHTLATRVYEKGPQSLADAIKEVEKPQAAPQLTATLLPSSSVNTMSSDDDKCIQRQELGHMACHCPHIKCSDCDEDGHVAADCPDKKSHHQVHEQGTEITVPTQDDVRDPHLAITIEIGTITMIIRTDIGLASQDPIPKVIATGVTVKVTHKGVIAGPITNPHTAAHHATETQVHTTTNETLHTEDPHHRSFSRHHSRSRPHASHNHNHKISSKPSYSSDQTAWKNKDRKYKQVTIDDPPSNYYSSDEQASKSYDDLNYESPLLVCHPMNGEGCPKRILLPLHT